MVYQVLAPIIHFLVNQYFRRIVIRGTVLPKGRPVLLVANHPNYMLDALLIGVSSGRPISFIAKATLFKVPFLRGLLRGAGVLPIARKQDGDQGRSREQANQEIFAKVVDGLQGGQAVAIFPEGVSHAHRRIKEIRTGAARIAASYQQVTAQSLAIQPVGINYENFHRFRSSVTVVFGEPFEVHFPSTESSEGNHRDAVREVSRQIEAQLLRYSGSFQVAEHAWLFELIAQFYSFHGTAGDDFERLTRIREAILRYADVHPSEAIAIEAALREYFGFIGSRIPLERPSIFRFALLTLVFPMAMLGALVSWLPYQMVRRLHVEITPYPVQTASFKLVLGLVIYLSFYCFSLLFLAVFFAEIGVVVWSVCILSAVLTKFYWWPMLREFALWERIFSADFHHAEYSWRVSLLGRLDRFRMMLEDELEQ